jgi:general secretion pathway protein H
MQCDSERGFTLLEMIVVLVVLGLALGLVISHGPARSERLELDAAARQVAGALRVARSRAIADDRVVTVTFGPGLYGLEGDAPRSLPGDVAVAGVRLIRFTPDGESSGGQIVLRNGDRRIAIGVDWLTGRVRLSEGG